MTLHEAIIIEKVLFDEANFIDVKIIDGKVPNTPGLYCIRLKNIDALPKPFNSELEKRGHNIIYIGIASQSLNRRLLNQELRANGHGTFFRSIGAVLGYRPPFNSLADKVNKRNYKFSADDETKIIQWINQNLLINWVEKDFGFKEMESTLILKYKPLLNISKNPYMLNELSKLRNECIEIANGGLVSKSDSDLPKESLTNVNASKSFFEKIQDIFDNDIEEGPKNTLHEAIAIVLKESKNPMSAKEIADIINKQKLYTRTDGNPVPSSQIHARVKNYPSLFRKLNGNINLIESVNSEISQLKRDVPLEVLMHDLDDMLYADYGLDDIDRLLFITELVIALDLLIRKYGESDSNSSFIFNIQSKLHELQIDDPRYNGEYDNIFDHLISHESVFSNRFSKYLKASFLPTIKKLTQDEVYNITYDFLQGSRYFGKTSSGEFVTPEFINDLMVLLTNPQENEIVYDPAAGRGNSLLTAYRINKNIFLVGQEHNANTASLASLNLYLNKCANYRIWTSNSLTEPIYDEGFANVIITDPPIGRSFFDDRSVDFKRISKDKSLDTLFFELMLSRLNEKDGRMAIVVPNSFLYRSSNLALRNYIIESDQLDTVVSLPIGSFAPHSSINASIVIINKRKLEDRKGKVLFINCEESIDFKIRNREVEVDINEVDKIIKIISNLYNGKGYNGSKVKYALITKEEIAHHNYDYNTHKYTSEVGNLIKEVVDKENLTELGQLLQKSETTSIVRPDEPLKIVQINDLNDNENEFYLNLSDLRIQTGIKPSYRVVSDSALLLAKIGNKLKPTYFKKTNETIAIISNILAFDVKQELIHFEYLISQLNSEFVKNQLSLLRKGQTIPFYKIDDLLSLKIPLPSLTEQLNKLANYKEQQANKFKLIKFINDVKLVTNSAEVKDEIERFARKIFTESEVIVFKSEFDFDMFPFSKKEISGSVSIKQSQGLIDGEENGYAYLLLKGDNSNINGVLIIDTENKVSFEQHSEIEAYANFLIKASHQLAKQIASDSLAKFAHTSKNFFSRLTGEIKSITESTNQRIKEELSSLFVESDAIIERKKAQGKNVNDYLAMNKLNKIDSQISAIANFYSITDLNFKQIKDGQYTNFDIVKIINDCIGLAGEVKIDSSDKSIEVYSKPEAIKQSIVDLLQNAVKYSPDSLAEVKIATNEHFVEINIVNKTKLEGIIPEETYLKLGNYWLTAQNEFGISSGLYWAKQAVDNSNGSFNLLPYIEYVDQRIFKVIIKLKRQV